MIKALIIDDEVAAVNVIETIIGENFPEIIMVGKAHSVINGIKLINTEEPQLVFLDIELKDATGFDLLDALPDRRFHFIFVTGFDSYAIKAFKYSAVDYVLKPVDEDELIKSVQNAIKKIELNFNFRERVTLLENIKAPSPFRLCIPSVNKFEYINANDIIYIEADGRYCKVFMIDGTEHYVSKPIGEFAELLEGGVFIRIHKSYIVNIRFVKAFVKTNGGYIELNNGIDIPIARERKTAFLTMMEGAGKNN